MLKTKRLILRAARQTDLEDLFKIYSNPQAMRFWSTPPNSSRTETQKRIECQMEEAKTRLVYFVIEMDGQAIGQCGMHGADEFGFILHPRFWRKGIITEASKTIIPYLFDTNGLDKLTADVDPLNTASVAALKSLGFVETHRASNTYCINGVWSDSIYLALTRREMRQNTL